MKTAGKISVSIAVIALLSLFSISCAAEKNRAEKENKKFMKLEVTVKPDVLGYIETLAKEYACDDVFREVLRLSKEQSDSSGRSELDLFMENFNRIAASQNRSLSDYFNFENGIVDENTFFKQMSGKLRPLIDETNSVIARRLDMYGIDDVEFTKISNHQYKIMLSGRADEKEISSLIERTGRLGFYLVKNNNKLIRSFYKIDSLLALENRDSNEVSVEDIPEDSAITNEEKAAKYFNEHPFTSLFYTEYVRSNENEDRYIGQQFVYFKENMDLKGDYYFFIGLEQIEEFNSILGRQDIKRLLPEDIKIFHDAEPEVNELSGNKTFGFYAVKLEPELTGNVIIDARIDYDERTNRPEILMEMNGEGTEKWAVITGQNIKKRIAMVIDDAVFTAPVIQSKITGGSSSITGSKDIKEAVLLKNILLSGSLKLPVKITAIKQL